MKTTIFAIAGMSGAGKTTLARLMSDRLGIPSVPSFTTRPMRDGESDGDGHIFKNRGTYRPGPHVLAHTVFGGEDYWAERSQVDGRRAVSYVIDERGLDELRERWGGEYSVVSVLVERPDNPVAGDRRRRDAGRRLRSRAWDVRVCNDAPGVERFWTRALLQLAQPVANALMEESHG